MQTQIDEYRALIVSLKTGFWFKFFQSVSDFNHGSFVDKDKERSTLNTHASRVAPELHAYETLLACSIEGMEKEQLLISFRGVDISGPDREFSFILDVSCHDYKGLNIRWIDDTSSRITLLAVVKTSPPLPSLPLLVDKLNVTQDIFTFIVQIRQEFHRMANGDEGVGV